MEPLGFIAIIIIAVVIFLICRELNCWYLKINARKELLEKLAENQKEIIRLLKKQTGEEVLEESPKVVAKAQPNFTVGQKVKTLVDKNNLPVGVIVRIDRIDGNDFICSQEMAEVGKYSRNEVEAL